MATRMQQRRGTSAEWAQINPVLSAGEVGFETDTKIFKLGDGVSTWDELTPPFVSTGGGEMTGPLGLVAPQAPEHGARLQDLNNRVNKAGDDMTGPLGLVAPQQPNHAVRVQDIPPPPDLTPYLLKSGGAMSGPLLLPNGTSANPSVRVGSDANGFFRAINEDRMDLALGGQLCWAFLPEGILPVPTGERDLGSENFHWRNLYMKGNLFGARLIQYREAARSVSVTPWNIDFIGEPVQNSTRTLATTVTWANIPTGTSEARSVTMISRASALTWPSGTKFPQGQVPIVSGETWFSVVGYNGVVTVFPIATGVATP